MKSHSLEFILFPFTFPPSPSTITDGAPANLDKGIRALPRFSGAEEEQEEGAAL